MIRRDEGEGRIQPLVHHGQPQAIPLRDAAPCIYRRAAKRIRPDIHTRGRHGLQVENLRQRFHVPRQQVLRVHVLRPSGPLVRHPEHLAVALLQQSVCALLDGPGDALLGRTSARGVVLNPAILRRIVAGRKYQPVREAGRPVRVEREDGARDHRRGGGPLTRGADNLHAIGREHFQGRAMRGCGKRMRIHADEERPRRAKARPQFRHRLRDGQNVRLVERSAGGGSTVTGGAERNTLRRVGGIGNYLRVVRQQAGNVVGDAGYGAIHGLLHVSGFAASVAQARRAGHLSRKCRPLR